MKATCSLTYKNKQQSFTYLIDSGINTANIRTLSGFNRNFFLVDVPRDFFRLIPQMFQTTTDFETAEGTISSHHTVGKPVRLSYKNRTIDVDVSCSEANSLLMSRKVAKALFLLADEQEIMAFQLKIEELQQKVQELQQKVEALEKGGCFRCRARWAGLIFELKKFSHFSGKAPTVDKRKCFGCQQTGHIRAECPLPEPIIRCYKCDKEGHFSRDCPFHSSEPPKKKIKK